MAANDSPSQLSPTSGDDITLAKGSPPLLGLNLQGSSHPTLTVSENASQTSRFQKRDVSVDLVATYSFDLKESGPKRTSTMLHGSILKQLRVHLVSVFKL